MKTAQIIAELNKKYPNGIVIENKNARGKTTEIICELPQKKVNSANKSIAIAVIDSSTLHYHRVITETYHVISGILHIFKYDQNNKQYMEYALHKGEAITILPGEIHSNLGDATWVEVVSSPAWFIEDYYNLDTIIKKYTKRA